MSCPPTWVARQIYKFDRICRDIHSFCFFVDTLRQHNVTLISAVEGFDSSIFLGRALTEYLFIFAEMERASHSERCRRGWERRKQRMEGC